MKRDNPPVALGAAIAGVGTIAVAAFFYSVAMLVVHIRRAEVQTPQRVCWSLYHTDGTYNGCSDPWMRVEGDFCCEIPQEK